MKDPIFLLLVLAGIGWFWIDSLRAKELATALCEAACQRAGLQLLDQTVALRHLSLRPTFKGLRLRRVYCFEFSEEGRVRRNGYLILLGTGLEEISFGLPQHPKDA